MKPEEGDGQKRQQKRRHLSPAALAFWAAAAAARAWSASIREHAACAARTAALSAEDEANGDIKKAIEGCGRVPDAQGRPGAAAMALVTDAMMRAAKSLNAAAEGCGRSSGLYGEAATEAARAHRAFGRVGDAQYAGIMRSMAARARVDARGAAKQAAEAAETAGALLRDAGRLGDCAAKWASSEGGRGKRAVDMRRLALALADTWEDAKRSCLNSSIIAEKAAELERATAIARGMAADVARAAAGEAAAAAEAAAEAAENGSGNGGGQGRDDQEAERAAAAWRRAMAAANRADAEHSEAGKRSA